MKLTFRPINDDDLPFLARLYATTRAEEMAVVPWSEEEKASFVRSQFEAQHKFYAESFPKCAFRIVLLEGVPIGRLYVDRRADEIRLVDIAILPEYRNQGIGGSLMNDVLVEGRRRAQPVRIHVEHNNPAMRLYKRLGFQQVDENGVYHLMEWVPKDR